MTTITNQIDNAMKQRAISAATSFIAGNRNVAETARDYIAAFHGSTWEVIREQPEKLYSGLRSLLSLQMGEWLNDSNVNLDADSWESFGRCTASAMKRSAIQGVKIQCRMRLDHSAPLGRKTPKNGTDCGYDVQKKHRGGSDDKYRFVEYQIVQPDTKEADKLAAMPSVQVEFSGDVIDVRDLYENDFPANPELPARIVGIQAGAAEPVVNETAWAERENHALRQDRDALRDDYTSLLTRARDEIAEQINIAQTYWQQAKEMEIIIAQQSAMIASLQEKTAKRVKRTA